MFNMKRLGRVGAAAAIGVVGLLGAPAGATTVSDRGAAILVWPKIVVDSEANEDTLMQIGNLSAGTCSGGIRNGEICTVQGDCPGGSGCTGTTAVIAAHCFYVNANRHCDNTGEVCADGTDCDGGQFTGSCVDGWSEVNFDIFLTPDQPLSWQAGEGLGGSDLPCRNYPFNQCSVNGNIVTNAGTRIPPAPEDPFIGELKCIQVDSNTRQPAQCDGATCRNDLIGHATLFNLDDGFADGAKYNAVGLVALSNDGDGTLNIGPGAEYDSCPGVLVLNHLFDGANDPINDTLDASTELTLVPCAQDLYTGTITPVTAQFLVYNEFEQRFSASRQVSCLLDTPISNIDTTQSDRSIFNASVSGTIAGQTRITGVNGGLIGAAVLEFGSEGSSAAAYNLNQQVDRETVDVIRIP